MVSGAAPSFKQLHLFWVWAEKFDARMMTRNGVKALGHGKLDQLLSYDPKGEKGALETLEMRCA